MRTRKRHKIHERGAVRDSTTGCAPRSGSSAYGPCGRWKPPFRYELGVRRAQIYTAARVRSCPTRPTDREYPVLPVLTHHLFTPRLKCHQRSPWMVGSRFLPGSFASTVDAGSLPRRLSAVNGVRSGRELFIRPLLRQPLHARSQSPAALRARAVYPPAPPSTSPSPFPITGSATLHAYLPPLIRILLFPSRLRHDVCNAVSKVRPDDGR